MMPITNDTELAAVLSDALDYLRSKQQVVAQSTSALEFERLKKLVFSDEWPEAVPPYLICEDNEEDKVQRAVGILSLVSEELKDKKFLDFGCGEGHVVAEAAKTAKLAVGFDATPHGDLWNGSSLTTDWNKIKENAPYDVVVLFDVLDHSPDPAAVLRQVGEVCTPATCVFCRCHPWMSPHATHHYRKHNKAYVHLVFTEEELKQLGIECTPTQKAYYPIDTTNNWFRDGGFDVVAHETQTIAVPAFFKENPDVLARLPLVQYDGKFPEWQMSQVFNDYVLSKSS
jgi:2-polyprenyl-3-methyl-5-hydroxy-6-metoxy-1,4-benzoquinol methylase